MIQYFNPKLLRYLMKQTVQQQRHWIVKKQTCRFKQSIKMTTAKANFDANDIPHQAMTNK